jgi:hypothetical protein
VGPHRRGRRRNPVQHVREGRLPLRMQPRVCHILASNPEDRSQTIARRTVVELTDDLDGSPAKETVTFGLDGKDLEIDLSEEHAKALRDALKPYVAAARRASGTERRGRRGALGPGRDAEQIKAIREWAKQQGMDVSERGRIPARIEEAYQRRTD